MTPCRAGKRTGERAPKGGGRVCRFSASPFDFVERTYECVDTLILRQLSRMGICNDFNTLRSFLREAGAQRRMNGESSLNSKKKGDHVLPLRESPLPKAGLSLVAGIGLAAAKQDRKSNRLNSS